MATNWFKDCDTLADIRSTYHRLAMQYHPDRPTGNTEIMKAINLAYECALRNYDGQATTGDDGQEHKYYYNSAVEQAIIAAIAAIIREASQRRLTIDLWQIGSWLWAAGSTYAMREWLKSQDWFYVGRRKAWACRFAAWEGHRTTLALPELASLYGGRKVSTELEQDALLQSA